MILFSVFSSSFTQSKNKRVKKVKPGALWSFCFWHFYYRVHSLCFIPKAMSALMSVFLPSKCNLYWMQCNKTPVLTAVTEMAWVVLRLVVHSHVICDVSSWQELPTDVAGHLLFVANHMCTQTILSSETGLTCLKKQESNMTIWWQNFSQTTIFKVRFYNIMFCTPQNLSDSCTYLKTHKCIPHTVRR